VGESTVVRKKGEDKGEDRQFVMEESIGEGEEFVKGKPCKNLDGSAGRRFFGIPFSI
jgi:hypothetical protein